MKKVSVIVQKCTASLEEAGGARVEVVAKEAFGFQKLEKSY